MDIPDSVYSIREFKGFLLLKSAVNNAYVDILTTCI